ncbi:hypothetical protein DTO027I6_10322 [Penicillium roqueforti]|nr:hypothetical protein DTO027I6_10322 [Penicillium roqueforti]
MTASVPEQPRSRGIQWPSINDYTRTINVPNLPQRQSVQPLDISSTAGEPERPQSRGIKWPSVNKIPRTIDMQKRPRRHSVRQPSSGDLPITDEEPEQHQGRRLPWEPIYDTSRKTKTPNSSNINVRRRLTNYNCAGPTPITVFAMEVKRKYFEEEEGSK